MLFLIWIFCPSSRSCQCDPSPAPDDGVWFSVDACKDALECLCESRTVDEDLPHRRWREAERTFRRALDIDPDLAEAHLRFKCGIATARFCQKGIDHAPLAVDLRHDFPEAHFQLGAVLSRRGWYDRAIQALEISLRMRPGFVLAHRCLSRIHQHLGQLERARKHREIADRLMADNVPQPPVD